MSKEIWLDAFLFWDAIIVGILIFIDWLMGETKRSQIRDKMGEWWIYVQDMSFSGLVSKDAEVALGLFRRTLGNKLFGFRFIATIGTISLIITALSVYASIIYDGYNLGHPNPLLVLDPREMVTWLPGMIYRVGIPLVAINILSVIITMSFLTAMVRSTRFITVSFLLVSDVVIALFLWWFYLYFVMFIQADLMIGQEKLPLLLSIRYFEVIVNTFYKHTPSFPGFVWMLFILGATSVIPTLIHAFICVIFIGSKLFKPILKPITSVLLYAFHDSKQGVLTTLAVAIGFMAKLAQIGVKVYAS